MLTPLTANTKDSHANDYQNFIVLLLFGPIELIARFNAQHVYYSILELKISLLQMKYILFVPTTFKNAHTVTVEINPHMPS